MASCSWLLSDTEPNSILNGETPVATGIGRTPLPGHRGESKWSLQWRMGRLFKCPERRAGAYRGLSGHSAYLSLCTEQIAISQVERMGRRKDQKEIPVDGGLL
jgi:hypothetical protein